MKRVAVVGSGGAGKSTFCLGLSERTGLLVVHLDEHFWQPGWIETPPQPWRARQEELFNAETWIADGNYGGSLDIRLSRADTLVILAIPRLQCIGRVLFRTLRNRGRSVQAPGCPERFDWQFVKWIWRYPVDSRPRLDAAIAQTWQAPSSFRVEVGGRD